MDCVVDVGATAIDGVATPGHALPDEIGGAACDLQLDALECGDPGRWPATGASKKRWVARAVQLSTSAPSLHLNRSPSVVLLNGRSNDDAADEASKKCRATSYPQPIDGAGCAIAARWVGRAMPTHTTHAGGTMPQARTHCPRAAHNRAMSIVASACCSPIAL